MHAEQNDARSDHDREYDRERHRDFALAARTSFQHPLIPAPMDRDVTHPNGKKQQPRRYMT